MVLAEILAGAFLGDISTLENIKNNYQICSKTDKLLTETYYEKEPENGLTHYGYQIRILAEYISGKTFDFEEFKRLWIRNMSEYSGYIDEASRKSLEYYESGYLFGYESEELGGAARIGALISLVKNRESALENALEQVQVTHTSYKSLLITEFLVKFLYRISETGNIKESALFITESFRNEEKKYEYLKKVYLWAAEFTEPDQKIKESATENFSEEDEFPVIMYICMKYNSFDEARHADIRIKGDFAVRGIILGMIFGAAGKINDESLGIIKEQIKKFLN
jgi:hypothetical protein